MLHAVRGIVLFVCHAEKAVTDRCGHRDGGFALSFPPTLSACVQSEGSYWAPSPLPFTLWPCSRRQSPGSPLGFLHTPPACPHACAALALTPPPRKFGGGRGWRRLRRPRRPSDAARPLPPSTGEAHLLCLAACAHVGQGDRLTLILSLAQSWRGDFWKFLPENLHFWGLSVLSPAYQ